MGRNCSGETPAMLLLQEVMSRAGREARQCGQASKVVKEEPEVSRNVCAAQAAYHESASPLGIGKHQWSPLL